MACNINLLIKGEKDPISILEGVESSTSFNTILETISTWTYKEIEILRDKLKLVQGSVDYSETIGNGRWLIGTTSFSELRTLFPEELKDLEDNNYNITLLDNRIYAGKKLKGRVNIDGKILYIFTNKEDVKQFAKTEKLRKYIQQYSEEFPTNLKNIANIYNKSVKDLLLDFIYNKNSYHKDIKQGLIVYDELQNFCKQLLNESIYIDESETQFAKYLRILNSSKSIFGKLDLYKAFKEFFVDFNISEEEFMNFTESEMNNLFQKYLSEDLIMSQYEVIQVSKTKPTKYELSQNEIEELYNKIKKDDISLKDAIKLKYDFFPKTIQINNKTVELLIQKDKFYYEQKVLDNDSKIALKNNNKSIQEIFGYSTIKHFLPVQHEKITDKGEYKGYYIYKVNEKYIITNSALHLDSYPYKICNSIEEAINTIDKYNPKIEFALKKVLKNDFLRQVKLPFNTVLGQTISSINYKIPTTMLPADKYKLLKGTVKDVLDFYNISELKNLSAEQLGIFIYEESLTNKSPEEIINKIKSLPVSYYLVDKVKDNQVVYLTEISESEIFNEGTKLFGTEKKFKDNINLKQLQDLKSHFSNTIFKNTPIDIEIYSSNQIKELKTDQGKQLITDPSKVRAFVHNNIIYINQDLASAEDLVHEALHIMFGVLKVKGIYESVISKLYNEGSYDYSIFNSKEYKNLAYVDKVEEAIVSYIASSIYGSHSFSSNFGNITKTMQEWFNKVVDKRTYKKLNDLAFTTTLQNIETESTLIKNRTLTNLIELGIENKKIIENCQ